MTTVCDFLLQRLHDRGVPRSYGHPGDGINRIMGALQRPTDQIRTQTVKEAVATNIPKRR